MRTLAITLATCAFAATAFAQDTDEVPAPSPGQIVEAASQEEWIDIPAEDLVVMTLAPDRDRNAREVVIQLIPAPFSQGWVDNIRLLARSGWYDETAVIRVQDNYVTQWGDPDADTEDAKPLPDGLKAMAEDEYVVSIGSEDDGSITLYHPRDYFEDNYANWTKHFGGWPLAYAVEDGTRTLSRWPTHCYGMVGVARGMSPSTGDGSSLYTVIGHAPRHLDRNIALVGRVIEGMEHLSSLPRGKGDLGFYEDKDKQTQILSVQVASDIEEFPQPAFEFLSTEGESFARYAEARANRRDSFFIQPAGGADICNIPVPVRRVATD